MTKVDIVEKIRNELGFQKKESAELLESVFTLMKDTLATGEAIKLSGFGSLVVKQKNNRRGRNPQTGETITIGSCRILTYKVSSVLKDAINKVNP